MPGLKVPDKNTAETLVNEWLKLWTQKHALPVGQYIQGVYNQQAALIEIVKYGSKI